MLYLGVVKEDGANVLIWDAAGRPKTFQLKKELKKGEQLCFSTHGHPYAAEFMTPCFDEDGLHGEPEEDCFCGVDTPHIHAHMFNPDTCQDNKVDASYLANLTLYPVEDEDDDDEAARELKIKKALSGGYGDDEDDDDEGIEKTGIPTLLSISEHLPKECNSVQFHQHTSSEWSAQNKRMYKVLHEDHEDYLVHNARTNQLHLEHPSCDDCGHTDVHGKLDFIGERPINTAHSDKASMHFFSISKKAFNFLDVFAGMIDTHSTNRVQVAIPCKAKNGERGECCDEGVCDGGGKMKATEPADADKKTKPCDYDEDDDCCAGSVCTSQKNKEKTNKKTKKKAKNVKSCCDGGVVGCCSTENVEPKTKPCCESGDCDSCISNKTASTMIQDYEDPAAADGNEREPMLKKTAGGYGATTSSAPHVRSEFFVKEICCASEIPAVRGIVEPMPGVSKVSINVPNKTMYVEHDAHISAAQQIADALNKDLFGASVVRDGGKTTRPTNTVAQSAQGRSEFFVKEICCASEIPAVRGIVEPMPGVSKVSINVPNKTLYVDHDTLVLSAQQIAEALNEDLFGASVVRDASATASNNSGIPTLVESLLSFDESLEPVKEMREVLGMYAARQLESFDVDDLKGVIVVRHNPLVLSVQQVVERLKDTLDVDAVVEKDGGAGIRMQALTTEVVGVDKAVVDPSDEVVEDVQVQSLPKTHVVLAGVFWIISLFSLLGGPW